MADLTRGNEFFPLNDTSGDGSFDGMATTKSGKKFQSIRSYFKNVTKSVVGIAGEMADNYVPNVKEFGLGLKDTIRNAASAAAESRAKAGEKFAGGSITGLISKTTKEFATAASKAVKTGELYTQAKFGFDDMGGDDFGGSDNEFNFSNEFGGEEFNFDNFDTGGESDAISDFDKKPNASSSRPSMSSVRQNFIQTSDSEAILMGFGKVAESTNRVNYRISRQQFLVEEQRFQENIQYQKAIAEATVKMSQYFGQEAVTMNAAAMEYMAKSIALQQDTIGLLKDVKASSEASRFDRFEDANRESAMNKITAGGFDGDSYFNNIKDNIKNMFEGSMLGQVMGMGNMVKEMSSMDQRSTGEKLFSLAMGNLPSLFLSSKTKSKLSRLNSVFENAGAQMMMKFNSVANFSENPILRSIGTALGVQGFAQRKSNMGLKDPYAKVDFDAKTHMSINEVIPTLLSKIYASVSGEEEIFMDYKTGQFRKASTVMKRFKADEEYAYESDAELVNLRGKMARDVSKIDGANVEAAKLEKDFKSIQKNIVDTRMTFEANRAESDPAYRRKLLRGSDGWNYGVMSLDLFIKRFKKMAGEDKLLLGKGIAGTLRSVDQFNAQTNSEYQKYGGAMVVSSELNTQQAEEYKRTMESGLFDKRQLDETSELYVKDEARRKQIRDKIINASADIDRLTSGAVGVLRESSFGTVSGARSTQDLITEAPITQNALLKNIYELLTDGIIVFPRNLADLQPGDHLVQAKYIKKAQAESIRIKRMAAKESEEDIIAERQKYLMDQSRDAMMMDYVMNTGGMWGRFKNNGFDRFVGKSADRLMNVAGKFMYGGLYNTDSEEVSSQEEMMRAAVQRRKEIIEDGAKRGNKFVDSLKNSRFKAARWIGGKAEGAIKSSLESANEEVEASKTTARQDRIEEAKRIAREKAAKTIEWTKKKLVEILGEARYSRMETKLQNAGQTIDEKFIKTLLINVKNGQAWVQKTKDKVIEDGKRLTDKIVGKAGELKDSSIAAIRQKVGPENFDKLVSTSKNKLKELFDTFGIRPDDTVESYFDRVGSKTLGEKTYGKVKGKLVQMYKETTGAVMRDFYGNEMNREEYAKRAADEQAAWEARRFQSTTMRESAYEEGIANVQSELLGGKRVRMKPKKTKQPSMTLGRETIESPINAKVVSNLENILSRLDSSIQNANETRTVDILNELLDETKKMGAIKEDSSIKKVVDELIWIRTQIESGAGIPVNSIGMSEAYQEALSKVLSTMQLLDPKNKDSLRALKEINRKKKGFFGSVIKAGGRVLASPFTLVGGVFSGGAKMVSGAASGFGRGVGGIFGGLGDAGQNAGRAIGKLFSGSRDPFQYLRGDIDKPSVSFSDLFVRAKDLYATGKINKTELIFFLQEAYVGKNLKKEEFATYLKTLEKDTVLQSAEYRKLYTFLMTKGDITTDLEKPKRMKKKREATFDTSDPQGSIEKKKKSGLIGGTLKFLGRTGGGLLSGLGNLFGGAAAGSGGFLGGLITGAKNIVKNAFEKREQRLYGTPLQSLRGDIDKPSKTFYELCMSAQDLYATGSISKVEFMFFIQEAYDVKKVEKTEVIRVLKKFLTDKTLSQVEYRRLHEDLMQKGSLVADLERPKEFKKPRKSIEAKLKKPGLIQKTLSFAKGTLFGKEEGKLGGIVGFAKNTVTGFVKSGLNIAKKMLFGRTTNKTLQNLRKEVKNGDYNLNDSIEKIKTLFNDGDVNKDELLYFIQEIYVDRKVEPKIIISKIRELSKQKILDQKETNAILKDFDEQGSLVASIPIPKSFKKSKGIIGLTLDAAKTLGRGIKGSIAGFGTGMKKAWDKNKESGGGFLGGSFKALAGAIGGSVSGAVSGLINKKDPNTIREGSMADLIRDRKEDKKAKLMEQVAEDVHAIRKNGFLGGTGKKTKKDEKEEGGMPFGLPIGGAGGGLGKFFNKLLGIAGIAALGYGAVELTKAMMRKNEVSKAYDEGNVSLGEKAMLAFGGETGRYDALGNKIEDQQAYQASLLKPQAWMLASKIAGGSLKKLGIGVPKPTDIPPVGADISAKKGLFSAFGKGPEGSPGMPKTGAQNAPGGPSKATFRGPDGKFTKAPTPGMEAPKKMGVVAKAKEKIDNLKAKAGEKAGDVLGKLKKFFGEMFSKPPFTKFIKPKTGAKITETLTKFLAKNGAVQLAKAGVGFLLKAATPIGWALIGYDFIAGMAEANRHFRLGAGAQPNIWMRITAGLVNMISNLLFGLIPVEWAVTTIYQLIAGEQGKAFIEGAKKFNEDRGKILGVEGDRLVEFESRPWTEMVFGGDNRAAKTLGLKDEAEFKLWQDSKYKPLKDLFDKMKSSYGGDAILEPPATPEDQEKTEAFRRDYLNQAEGYISAHDSGIVGNASDKTTIGPKDDGGGSAMGTVAAGAAAMGVIGGMGSSAPAAASTDASGTMGAPQRAGFTPPGKSPVTMGSVGAGMAGAATAVVAGTGAAAAASAPETVKAKLNESPLQTKVRQHTDELSEQMQYAEDMYKESIRHNKTSEDYFAKFEKLMIKMVALLTPQNNGENDISNIAAQERRYQEFLNRQSAFGVNGR